MVSFSKRKNLELTSVAVGVIFSINQNNMKNQMSAVVDVLVKVLKLGEFISSSTIYIGGVRKDSIITIHWYLF